MAGRTITLGDGNKPDPDVVVLYEKRFTVRQVTRSVQKLLEQADKKIATALRSDDGDKMVAAMAEGMDALLAGDGHEENAKAVLVIAWKDDKLSLDELQRLYDELQESAAARPT